MKTQFSFSKSGFTLIEIMVVIAIIAFLFWVMSQISFRSGENLAKAERLANKIQWVLHNSAVNVMMGRMDQTKLAVTGATLTLTASGGGTQWMTWVYTPSMTGSVQAPFFDNDTKYEIRSIKWYDATSSGTTSTLTIQMDKNGTTFTGTSWWATFPSNSNILEIQVRYVDRTKKVIYDKRTGRIEINKEF